MVEISWSPDGSQIAFLGLRGELNTIAIDGGDLKKIASGKDIFHLAWSPAGEHIAFTSSHEGNAEIYVGPAEGGQARNVSNSPWPDTGPIRWSLDGRQLIFSSQRSSPEGIYAMAPDRSEVRRLTVVPIDEWLGARRRFAPYGWPLTAAHPDLLTSCPPPPLFSPAGCLSPDGQLIAAITRGTSVAPPQVAVLQAGAAKETILTPPGVEPVRPDVAWSPDGTRIAFYGQDKEGFWLYTLEVASGTPSRLASAGPRVGDIEVLQWSPDGEYIYHTKGGYCKGGCIPGYLYRIRPDGTGEEQLTDLRVSAILGFAP